MSETTKVSCDTLIDAELLAEAQSLNINPSEVLEQALRNAISQAKAELWRKENEAAIEYYNQQVAEQGTFAERLKSQRN